MRRGAGRRRKPLGRRIVDVRRQFAQTTRTIAVRLIASLNTFTQRDAGQRLKKEKRTLYYALKYISLLPLFCRDNPFQPPLKPGSAVWHCLPRPVLSGVSLSAFLTQVYPSG